MRSRAPLFLIIATTGCLNEYHPEYHPVTTTTIVQNVSSPTTVITQNEVHASPTASPPPVSTREQPQIARNEIEPKKAQKSNKTSSCPAPPFPLTRGGIELGPNVAIGPGVYFGGDVYVKGDLIVGGTREHPQLLTQ
jgi:hypothetical protein